MTIMIEEPTYEVSPYEETELKVKALVTDWKEASLLPIGTEPHFLKMTSVYSRAKELKNEIEDRRKKLIAPSRKRIAFINDLARPIEDTLDYVIDFANNASNKYMHSLEEANKEKEARLNAIGAMWGCDEEVSLEPVKNIIRGNGAMMIKKSEKRFRLVDITKIPEKYLMVNEEAVKRDLKLGVETIPGIEVYEEKTTQLRVR